MDSNTIGAIINAVPLAFIGWLFLSLSRRIDTLTTRIDRLYDEAASSLSRPVRPLVPVSSPPHREIAERPATWTSTRPGETEGNRPHAPPR